MHPDGLLPLRLALDLYPDDNEAWAHTDLTIVESLRGYRSPKSDGSNAYGTPLTLNAPRRGIRGCQGFDGGILPQRALPIHAVEATLGAVVEFSGGRHCVDCDEQIEPRRLRARPDAKRCVSCQHLSERRLHANLQWMRDDDIAIIRRR